MQVAVFFQSVVCMGRNVSERKREQGWHLRVFGPEAAVQGRIEQVRMSTIWVNLSLINEALTTGFLPAPSHVYHEKIHDVRSRPYLSLVGGELQCK